MSSIVSTFLTFLDPIGLTVILVYFYGSFSRSQPSLRQLSTVMGVVFGIATWVAMATPIEMSEGIFVDLRTLFVGVSAAFFGWRAALITFCMAFSVRLGMGGSGMIAGVLGISIASAMGLAWAAFVRPKVKKNLAAYLILAAMISTHLTSVFVLPWDVALVFLSTLAPIMFISNLIGTMIFALLIQREKTLAGYEVNLRFAATTDPLTDILNRRSVVEQYDALSEAAKPRRGIAMVCIDVDKFKDINDTYGHLPGDMVLVEVAQRISSCLRPSDLFARMSGDEFLIVLTNISSADAHTITDRCRKIIATSPIMCEGVAIRTTISVGTVWSREIEEFDTLRDAADTALYQAKEMGRDHVAFYGAGNQIDLAYMNDGKPIRA